MSTTADTYRRVGVQRRRDALVLKHLSLARHVIGKLLAELPPGLDLENLEAAGRLGLVEAANHYDPTRGVEFAQFARARIRGAVLDELRRNCPLPQDMMKRVARVRRAHESLQPPVTVEDLTAATGLSEDEVLDCLAAIRLTRPLSWDDLGGAVQSQLDKRGESPDAILERADQKRLLADAVAALPQRGRLVVTLYYMEDLRLKEIGRVLNLSESRVSRVLSAALHHLAEYLRARNGDR